MSVQNPSLPTAHPPSAALSPLEGVLRAATRRIRALLLLRLMSRALCVGAGVGLVVVGIGKLRGADAPDPRLIAGIVGIALLAAVVLALVQPLSELDVARLTERRADLKERLSSAVEFGMQGYIPSEPFYGEQLADAQRHAAAVDLKSAYPARMPRELAFGLIALLGLFLSFTLPTLSYFKSPQQKQDEADVKKAAIAIIKAAQDPTKAAEQQKLDESKKMAEEVRKLDEAMRKGQLNKKEALIAIDKLTRKMEEAQKQAAASQPAKPMEQARDEFKRSLDRMQKEAEEVQKQKEAANPQNKQAANAQKPGEKNATPPQQKQSDAMKQAQQALQQMAQALAEQDNQQMQQAMEKITQQMQSGQMSKEEMQQLQKALQQLSDALKGTQMDPSAQQLQQLSQQMAQGNLDPKTLQQMAAMARSLAKTMGQKPGMGKGQMDAQTLQQLEQALKDGRMTMNMGKGMGNFGMPNGDGNPGNGGKEAGNGWNGHGSPSKPMKDPGNTNPKLLAMGQQDGSKGIGKSGSAKEFSEYLNKKAGAPKHLPNGQIKGSRSKNGNELQMSMTGDPEAAKSNAPYYQVYQTSKKQAESTLNKENIPAAYKEQVREYFESIRP